MNRTCLLFAGILIFAAETRAQTINMDFGVATEVVRSMMSPDVGASISSSTNLMANYRNFALEQELAQEAARRGLSERIDVRRALEEQRRDILINALRNDVIRTVPPPAEATLRAEFRKQRDELIMPAAQKLDVFSISADQTQTIARAQAFAAESEEIAETLIDRGFVNVSGQLTEPWFAADQMTESIWEAVTAMERGQVEVFPDGANALLIRKLDERAARPMTYEEAEAPLRQFLMRDAQIKRWNEYVEEAGRKLGF